MDKSRKKIYILPNLITTASLACGLLAVIRAIHGDFQIAILLILVCAGLDMLDGQVARLTNSVSQFGAEYDSLSDAIAFGVAPACIIYLWVFQATTAGDGTASLWDKIGTPTCLFYSIATVLRLVRFNIQSGLMEKHVFRGLPSPAAAVFLMSCLWLLLDLGIHPLDYVVLIALLLVVLGVLMVSSVSFYSLKNISLNGRVPFITLLLISASLSVLTFDFALSLFFISLAYVLLGPLLLGIRIVRRWRGHDLEKASQTDKHDAGPL